MQKYVIERDLPGAGKLSPAELQAISQKSNDVLRGMGTKIQWVARSTASTSPRTRPISAATRRRAGSPPIGYPAS